jgi:hypothetical protein
MAANIKIDGFVKRFSGKSHFSKNDLLEYYHKLEPDLRDDTLRRRIYILKKRGVIREMSRGIYSFQDQRTWVPANIKAVKSIYSKIAKHYHKLEFTIWSTAWLGEFINLQAFHYLVIINVEKDFAESVFEKLQEEGFNHIYFKPNKKEVKLYFGQAKDTYVIETLVTKTPTQLVNKINIPRLEAVLVDLFCDKDLLMAYQGTELKNIFRKAFSTYTISISTLINYARRRGKENELMEFIKTKAGIKLPTL